MAFSRFAATAALVLASFIPALAIAHGTATVAFPTAMSGAQGTVLAQDVSGLPQLSELCKTGDKGNCTGAVLWNASNGNCLLVGVSYSRCQVDAGGNILRAIGSPSGDPIFRAPITAAQSRALDRFQKGSKYLLVVARPGNKIDVYHVGYAADMKAKVAFVNTPVSRLEVLVAK
jgi:hypothetical protein